MAKHSLRHVNFFALMDDLGKSGCPVCRSAQRAAEKMLSALFYEQVTDPKTRAAVRRGCGFCPHHTQTAIQVGNPLGSSIIYEDLLRDAAENLCGGSTKDCPVCRISERAERACLHTLLQCIEEDDVREAYEKNDGLCLRHLRQASGKDSSAAARLLEQIERRRVQELADQCAEFVRKSDYRHNDEPMGEERDAWRRAAYKMGGGFPEKE